MKKPGKEATLLSLIVLGTNFVLDLVSFGWSLTRSVLGAIFCAVLVWVGVYFTARRRSTHS